MRKALLALFRFPFLCAGVAQLVEPRFCTPAVAGSTPVTSSITVVGVGLRLSILSDLLLFVWPVSIYG